MSETIPEDIMKAARNARDSYNADPEWFLAGTAIRHIAAAILAERERCAKIAEQTDPEKPNSYLFKRERIASAVRTPSTGEET